MSTPDTLTDMSKKTARRTRNQDDPPVWVKGKVPAGFWDNPTHRRKYIRWLGATLGFAKRTDWYQLSKQDFHANYGGGLLANYYGDSPQRALLELYPKYAWKCWLFRSTPQGYWQNPEHRMEYMDWLGKKLGYKTDEDWYQITRADFHTNHGGGLLANYYRDSVFEAIKEYRPDVKWDSWLFKTVPQGFWLEKENRLSYLKWLGKKLGFRRTNDWYRLTREDFSRNNGEGLFITHYNGSRMRVLQELKPDHKWDADKLKSRRR